MQFTTNTRFHNYIRKQWKHSTSRQPTNCITNTRKYNTTDATTEHPNTPTAQKKKQDKNVLQMLHRYHNHTIHQTKHKKNNRNQFNKQRQYHHRTLHQKKQQQKPIQQTKPIPQSHVTPDETNRQQQQPTQQTQQKPQKDNIQTQPTEQQLSDSESDTDSSDSDLKTIPQPTLIPNGKRTLSPEELQSFLYWRGQVRVGGYLKKRCTLYPNQLYRYFRDKRFYKNKSAAESELEMYYEKTEIETDNGPKTYYMKYKEEQDALRQKCRWNDKMNNKL